jgi:hypothetical protein
MRRLDHPTVAYDHAPLARVKTFAAPAPAFGPPTARVLPSADNATDVPKLALAAGVAVVNVA